MKHNAMIVLLAIMAREEITGKRYPNYMGIVRRCRDVDFEHDAIVRILEEVEANA